MAASLESNLGFNLELSLIGGNPHFTVLTKCVKMEITKEIQVITKPTFKER